MQRGQWVAFDVSTEEPHVCGTEHEPDIAIKLKGKSKKKSKDTEESIDLGYDDDTNTNDDTESEIDYEHNEKLKKKLEEVKNSTIPLKKIKEEIYNTVPGIHRCINKAIKENKRIFIEYYSEWKSEHSSRELSPITKFDRKDRVYLQGYCHKEKAVRVFLTKSIEEATLINKKSFQPTKVPKPDIDKFLEKIETPEKENEEIAQPSTKAKKKSKKKIHT